MERRELGMAKLCLELAVIVFLETIGRISVGSVSLELEGPTVHPYTSVPGCSWHDYDSCQ